MKQKTFFSNIWLAEEQMLELYAYRILATFMIIIKVKVVLHCSRLRLTLSIQKIEVTDGSKLLLTSNIDEWAIRGETKCEKKCYIDILNKL